MHRTTRRLALATASTLALTAAPPQALAQYGSQADRDKQPEATKDEQAAQPSRQRIQLMLTERIIGTNVASKTGETAGEVVDLIVDAPEGHLKYALVSVGGWLGLGDKVIAVPVEQVRWDHDANVFVLGQTRARLQDMPAFDAEHWRDLRRSDWERALLDRERAAGAKGKGNMRPHQDPYDKTLIRVSDISGERVKTPARPGAPAKDREVLIERTRRPVGEIDGAVVEWNSRTVPFAVVSTGGVLGFGDDDRLVPWKAMRMDGEGIVLADITSERFDQLEAVTHDEIRSAKRPEHVKDWCKPFGMDAPTFERHRDSGG